MSQDDGRKAGWGYYSSLPAFVSHSPLRRGHPRETQSILTQNVRRCPRSRGSDRLWITNIPPPIGVRLSRFELHSTRRFCGNRPASASISSNRHNHRELLLYHLTPRPLDISGIRCELERLKTLRAVVKSEDREPPAAIGE